MGDLRQELLERYEATGKVGFTKPKDLNEAISWIDSVVAMYEESEKPEVKEEVVINIHDLAEKMKSFFATM